MGYQRFQYRCSGLNADRASLPNTPELWQCYGLTWGNGVGMAVPNGKVKGPAQRFYCLQQVRDVANSFNLYMTAQANSIGLLNVAGTYSSILGVGSNTGLNLWSLSQLNTFGIWNRGSGATTDPPWYLQITGSSIGTPVGAALPNWPANTNARFMRVYRNHLFAGNIRTGTSNYAPSLLMWSDVSKSGDATPPTWVAAAGNDAGSALVGDDGGQLVDAAKLRDTLMVYKEDQVYAVRYIGGNFIFAIEPRFHAFGAAGLNCVVPWNGRHLVVTKDDVVLHDGVQAESIAVGWVKRFIRNLSEAAEDAGFFATYSSAYDQFIIAIPQTSLAGNKNFVTWSPSSQKWGQYTLPASIGGVSNPDCFAVAQCEGSNGTSVDPEVWFATDGGFLRVGIPPGDTSDTNQQGVDIFTPWLDLGDPGIVKVLNGIIPIWADPANAGAVTITTYASDYPTNSSGSAIDTVSWTRAAYPDFCPVSTRGRYFRVRLQATAGDPPSHVTGLDLLWEPLGAYP